jgi:hypothetical protein
LSGQRSATQATKQSDAVHDAAQPIGTGNAEVEFGKALIAIAAASAF